MATIRKPLLLLLLLPLIFTQVTSDSSPETVEAFSSEPGDSALKHEVDHLKSKISSLESTIDERSHDLRTKDEDVRLLEMAIQEKVDRISSLQIEIEYLQQKASPDAKEQKSSSHIRAAELEKQIDNLRKEIDLQNKKKDALEVRTNVAEGKIWELNLKLEDIQRINSEQKSKIRKAEHSFQLAQEEMMKAKLRAASMSKELREVHGEWLPHWLAVHVYHFQSYLVSNWNEHGRPTLGIIIQKALEKKDQLKRWAEPQIRNFNMIHGEWLPHWLAVHIYHFQSYLVSQWNEHGRPTLDIIIQKALEKKDQLKRWAEPQIRNVNTALEKRDQLKRWAESRIRNVNTSYLVSHWNEHGRPTLDIIIEKALEKKDQLQRWVEPQIRNVNAHWIPVMKEECSNFINNLEPHLQSLLSKIIEVYDASKNSLMPHLVKARMLTDPYIQKAKMFSEPFFNQVEMVTKPYYETMLVALKPYTKAIRTYRKLTKSARIYHHQVQETLKSHVLTRSLANMDLAWFMATAVLTLPILVLSKLFSVIFSGLTKRRSFGAHIKQFWCSY